MNASKPLVALSAAGILLLAGCGGSAGPTSDAAAVGGSSTTPSSSAAGPADVSKVDVCALLSQEDAAAVARAHSLNGAQTAATVYTLTATPQTDTGTPPSSSCRFSIDGQGAQGTVVVQVQSADDFAIYSSGTKVDGLGDEAYRGQGTTVVRVGGLMLSAGEDSFSDDFVVDLYRKMIPHMK